jgi:hypothetical protein
MRFGGFFGESPLTLSNPERHGFQLVESCFMMPVNVMVVKLPVRPISISERKASYDRSRIDDEMPIATTYKGVAIHAGQSAKRVRLVKQEIDRVSRLSDPERLFEIAGDCGWSPEARLLAGARCIAGLQLATERREAQPDIDREDVEARTAGLDTIRWADPERYCSLLDMDPEHAVEREVPLDDDA